ncbi:MAG TPA: molybdate ABC transporter substrate-binding protein [Gallionella sp.]|nr:molybdate ABC transporter substrate-binding protein [Gallionella sp.]
MLKSAPGSNFNTLLKSIVTSLYNSFCRWHFSNPLVKSVIASLCFAFVFAHNIEVQGAPLAVAAVADAKYAFDDLAAEFKKESGIEVQGIFGSTGKIAAQVQNGAPYDVFLSDDMEHPEALYQDGLAVTRPKVYAYGVLVLWTKKELDLGRTVAMLGDTDVWKVAIANPKLASYGLAALKALENAGLSTTVVPKLIYGESVIQVAQFIDSGVADIGFVAKSQVVASKMAGQGKWLAVPEGSYDAIAQGVVVLKHGAETQYSEVEKFMEFLFTPKARAIFEKYGYVLP